jgi:hypothetical protein
LLAENTVARNKRRSQLNERKKTPRSPFTRHRSITKPSTHHCPPLIELRHIYLTSRYTFQHVRSAHMNEEFCVNPQCLRHKERNVRIALIVLPDARTFLFSSPFVAYAHARRSSVRITDSGISHFRKDPSPFFTFQLFFFKVHRTTRHYVLLLTTWFLSIDVASRIMHRDALDTFLTLPCNVSQSVFQSGRYQMFFHDGKANHTST